MSHEWAIFERFVRLAHELSDETEDERGAVHPFVIRSIHDKLPVDVINLFDNGHYPQATYEALKFVDKEIKRLSGSSKSGAGLMMSALGGDPPSVKLTSLADTSEKDEQEGYKFLFAGSMLGIRNPRGHEYSVKDDPDTCLDHLSFVSLLLKRLETAGYALIDASETK